MLKHQEIIEKLTTEQKLSLLADISSLGSDPISDMKFCGLSEASMEKLNTIEQETVYPSFAALANSWDSNIIYNVAEALISRAKRLNINLLEMPETNVKIMPYSKGLTEDPYLSGTMSTTIESAGVDNDMQMVMSDPSLSQTDALYSDEDISPRAVREFFQKPFSIAMQSGVNIVKTALPKLEGKFGEINAEWLNETEKRAQVIYECTNSRERIRFLAEGKNLCYGSSYAELKAAYDKYVELYKAFEVGSISLAEIEAERAAGGIITLEALDGAVDDIIDFIQCYLTASRQSGPAEIAPDLALSAAEASIVLLKNERILPLYKERVAIIGDLAKSSSNPDIQSLVDYFLEFKQQGALRYMGFARGYDIEEDCSNEHIEEAVALAKSVDVAVVVLGYNERGKERFRNNKTAKLPANQLALVDALARTGVKIIAVVCGDEYPDMQFDAACQAVLFAPLHTTKGAEALCNVLCGITNPSGKLAFTCYEGTDEHFDNLRAYKENGRNKVGLFYGYRHYDTSNLTVKYPFGHGLSYTKFAYLNVETYVGQIRFLVKNVGARRGSEIVQIYVGKEDSALLRPKKELKDFMKIQLGAGEETWITLNIKDLDLEVWDEKNQEFVTEYGRYQVYIGSSVADIRLKASFMAGTKRLEKAKEDYSDYLQAYSNIHFGEYTLEEPPKYLEIEKDGWRRFSIAWTILTLCFDIIYGYFHMIGWAPKEMGIYIFIGILNVIPMTIAAVLTAKHSLNKKKQQERSMKEKMKKRADLNVDDLADEIPYEQLFEEEFAAAPIVEEEYVIEENTQWKEERKRVEVPFDKELSLARVAEEFYTFAYERGVAVDKTSIRRLFAGFAASKLLVLKAADTKLLSNLLPILGEYFNSKVTMDSYAEIDAEYVDLLYNVRRLSERKLSAAANRIIGANEDSNKIRVMSLLEMKAAGIRNCLTPILRYVDQPLSETEISVELQNGKTGTFPLTEDMWFIVVLSEGEKLTDIPKYILDMASVTELLLQPGLDVIPNDEGDEFTLEEETLEEMIQQQSFANTEGTKKTSVKNLCYSQFKKLVKYACRDYQLEEVLWKRLDKLEQFVADCNEYRIENKQWQRVEKFISVYLAMGGEGAEALDCAIAQQLIYGMLPCVANSEKDREEKFTHALERIFGEGCVPTILSAVRATDLDV